MTEENVLEDALPIMDGIEKCEDKCPCGGSLRLHTYTFHRYDCLRKQRHYVDCDRNCGRVGNWKDTPEEAVASFDADAGIQEHVQEA